MYQNILCFKGTWRKYQQRVLDKYYDYKRDGKVHIVAAPGSGKTTLGIELIRLMNEPCIVLVPTITIREQWIHRMEEAFLKEGVVSSDVLSQNLRDMKLITVTSYQAIHSAMKQYKGTLIEECDEDISYQEEVDFEGFDLLAEISKNKIKTICLDECHHLRNEWWKSLEDFNKQTKLSYTIALTATPPYDSSPEMWLRYMKMCGQIDEEITVPELVKDGNLCPHQDYVYINYPTKEEQAKLKDFENARKALMEEFMADEQLEKIIVSHDIFKNTVDMDKILDNPAYLSSLLIYINHKNHKVPRNYRKLLGYTHLEKMSEKWLEILLQNMLYQDTESFSITKEEQEKYIAKLKTYGLIENRKVTLVSKPSIKKGLVRSIGKCESIKDICFYEYSSMKEKLRLLILCDYIKKDYLQAIGNKELEVHALGVIPIFELLRRENEQRKTNVKLGVLCGSIVIIPNQAKERLLELVDKKDKISFNSLGKLGESSYNEVKIRGDRHCLTEIVTKLFEEGEVEVLIGTKALLGEGWDSPCVNSLILASFVGSFMLSNQMRGRAIRSYVRDPNKTSNIWHLACIEKIQQNVEDFVANDDMETLVRRMEHFLGLHRSLNVIETGVERIMDVTKFNQTKGQTKRFNNEMLERSSKREVLLKRWQEALTIANDIEINQEVSVKNKVLTSFFLVDFIRVFLFSVGYTILINIEFNVLLSTFSVTKEFCYLLVGITAFMALIYYLLVIKQFISLGSPVRSLGSIGKGIRKALEQRSLFESSINRVEVTSTPLASNIYLKGGTGQDQALFSKSVAEFFETIDNQRYILYSKKHKNNVYGYFAIPDIFSKRKEDAEMFAKSMTPYIGKYEVIYTRNSEGRKILLKGRKKAFSNKQERSITGKRVKGALE
ncbi:DEAD/DEAH box helicase family protein [Tannockella kyphosi]|uniref:DEAD/DEAH box helicase family protein n=1 Tax=Tannockella kyphosi TaxID=2899121 RepID=UPI00201236BF|nr:DEAD/DEAH box helicase family protein [Tannockella kyphosi]